MVACVIGTILKVGAKTVDVRDRLTNLTYTCEVEGDAILELKENTQGIFVGQYLNSMFRVKHIEVRKFLDPLYEADLYDASGRFSLVPVLDDPFTETYKAFLKEQEVIDARESFEDSTPIP